jgi:quinol-cytochrome oxidoreductase complex cytochrome b subunit
MTAVTMDEISTTRTSGAPPNDDGTRQLLRWGASTLAVGVFFAILTRTVFGGISVQGPHTNAGWLGLIITMMCLPFGTMLFVLGAAKWFRQRRGGK